MNRSPAKQSGFTQGYNSGFPSGTDHISNLLSSPTINNGSSNLTAINPFSESPGRSAFRCFGELADETKIGELPADSDLHLHSLFAPIKSPHFGTIGGGFQQSAQLSTGMLSPISLFNSPPITPFETPKKKKQLKLAEEEESGRKSGQTAAEKALETIAATGTFLPVKEAEQGNQALIHPVELPKTSEKKKVKRSRGRKRRNDEDDDSSDEWLPRKKSPAVCHAGPTNRRNYNRRSNTNTTAKNSATSPTTAWALNAEGAKNSASVKASGFKGVSRHKSSGKYEASIWCFGKQLYLGSFETPEAGAQAHDMAALATRGNQADVNFKNIDYSFYVSKLQGLGPDALMAQIRSFGSGLGKPSRKSKYRGVYWVANTSGNTFSIAVAAPKEQEQGMWEVKLPLYQGRKNVSFGLFESEEEASKQFDRAMILEGGRNAAKLNWPIETYEKEVVDYVGELIKRNAQPDLETESGLHTLPKGRPVTVDDVENKTVVYAWELAKQLKEEKTQ